MKDKILVLLTMKDVLEKYGIKIKNSMFRCPFHGLDKHPSAKAYQNSFHCFTCQKNGDLIQFVQYYFNISFKEAMQKINEDFNLGLDSNTKLDYNKINQIKQERKKKQKIRKQYVDLYMKICNEYRKKHNKILELKNDINILNWECKVWKISQLETELDLLDLQLEEIDKKIS